MPDTTKPKPRHHLAALPAALAQVEGEILAYLGAVQASGLFPLRIIPCVVIPSLADRTGVDERVLSDHWAEIVAFVSVADPDLATVLRLNDPW